MPIFTFPIITQWKSCHVEFLSDYIFIHFHWPIDAVCEIWYESASLLQRRCHLKTLTDGRMMAACLYYKFTYKPSAQVN